MRCYYDLFDLCWPRLLYSKADYSARMQMCFKQTMLLIFHS